jgi:hypothetical protein
LPIQKSNWRRTSAGHPGGGGVWACVKAGDSTPIAAIKRTHDFNIAATPLANLVCAAFRAQP